MQYMCMDVNFLNLNNHMNREEYIIIQISMIPQEFIDKYNLKDKVDNRYNF